MVGIADPPREGLRELMRQFHQAGIRTRMITGDQQATAHAIGDSLGLSREGRDLEVLDSPEWKGNGDALNGDITQTHIFSRASPSDKLWIVQRFQQAGKCVGMTGDGVNDGPALKVADVGIALGKSGAETAREVADVILLEDDLEALVPAIREGRTVHDNIQKSVHYITATNPSEILTVLGCVAGGLGQPLNARQLLWINVLSDVFPALALAAEPAHPDVLQRPPQDPAAPILSRSDYRRLGREGFVLTGAGIGGYLYGMLRYGAGPQASTMAFLSVTSAQFAARPQRPLTPSAPLWPSGDASQSLHSHGYRSGSGAGVAGGLGPFLAGGAGDRAHRSCRWTY